MIKDIWRFVVFFVFLGGWLNVSDGVGNILREFIYFFLNWDYMLIEEVNFCGFLVNYFGICLFVWFLGFLVE